MPENPEAFDPYYKWLSIAPEDQPATLYRLLGLRTFEDDPEVIESAADRQMAHLRTFQSGKHSAESQKLLNEVSAAKLTLLNAKKRAEYDLKLREFMRRRAETGEDDLDLSSTLANFLHAIEDVGRDNRSAGPPIAGHDATSVGRVSSPSSAGGGSVGRVFNPSSGGAATGPGAGPAAGGLALRLSHPTGTARAQSRQRVLVLGASIGVGMLVLAVIVVLAMTLGGGSKEKPQDEALLVQTGQQRQPAPPAEPTEALPTKSAEPKTPSPAPVPGEQPAGLPVSIHIGEGGKELTVDLGGVNMEFVLIPAGEFVMGSSDAERQAALARATTDWVKERIPTEAPQRRVEIAQPFYLGKYEVTQAQWHAVMGSNPSQFQGPTNPVETISWDDVQPFLAKLNSAFEGVGWDKRSAGPPSVSLGAARASGGPALRLSRPTGPTGPMGFALPTEAQWEYACRAGTTTAYCCGDDAALLDEYGWSNANARGTTHPVGQRKPNAWGLYDMHGNVWEWCADGRADAGRVLRGGCWCSPPVSLRSAFRNYYRPAAQSRDFGFRLALVSAGEETEGLAELDKPVTEETSVQPTPGQAGTDTSTAGDGTQSVPAASGEKRLPVPPAAEQQKMARQFDEVYQFSRQRAPAEKVEVAKKLFELGKVSQGGPAEKFVAFRKAMELACHGGDAPLMFEVVDAICAEFEVNTFDAKQKVAADFVSGSPNGEQTKAFIDAADAVIDAAIQAGRHDVALATAEAAYGLARKSGDAESRKRSFDRRNEVRKTAEQFKALAAAQATLKTNPDDPAANLAVGRWLSFERGDWRQGLPHLAKSGDSGLEGPARQELTSPPTTAEAQVQLADAWWALVEQVQGREKEALMLHAGQWYRKAQEGLPQGLLKAKTEQRLAEVAKLGVRVPEKPMEPAKPAAPTASRLSKELFLDLGGEVKMEFVLIPAGEFIMGSPEPERQAALNEAKATNEKWAIERIPTETQHRVKITKPFHLGKYEVSQSQWQAVMGDNPSKFQDPTAPVEQVSWDDIQPFLAKLNTLTVGWDKRSAGPPRPVTRDGEPAFRLSYPTGPMRFTLPTEAQWEYACRAGATTAFFFGDGAALLGEFAWFGGAGGKTHPVGQKRPNAWGLYDMYGNVWEWCADWYGADYYGQSPPNDPKGPATGSHRVGRGGCWGGPAAGCRSAYRYDDPPTFRYFALGFRVALVPADPAAGDGKPDQPEPTKSLRGGAVRPSMAAKELAVDLAGGVKMEFVLIPTGEFVMGSPEPERLATLAEAKAANDTWAAERIPTEAPQHRVKLSRTFYLGKYEVTQAQWQAVMGNNPSKFPAPTNPVERVSWEDIQPFLAKLNAVGWDKRSAGPPDGAVGRVSNPSSGGAGAAGGSAAPGRTATVRHGVPYHTGPMIFALPTEAQWEYACRAGATTAFCFGDNVAFLGEFGWFNGNAGETAHPVGRGKPNAWGLYDVHGNVWEWCADWHGADYYAQSSPADPTGPSIGSARVIRGGGWYFPPGTCRAAFRGYDPPDARHGHLGFRLALVPARE